MQKKRIFFFTPHVGTINSNTYKSECHFIFFFFYISHARLFIPSQYQMDTGFTIKIVQKNFFKTLKTPLVYSSVCTGVSSSKCTISNNKCFTELHEHKSYMYLNRNWKASVPEMSQPNLYLQRQSIMPIMSSIGI